MQLRCARHVKTRAFSTVSAGPHASMLFKHQAAIQAHTCHTKILCMPSTAHVVPAALLPCGLLDVQLAPHISAICKSLCLTCAASAEQACTRCTHAHPAVAGHGVSSELLERVFTVNRAGGWGPAGENVLEHTVQGEQAGSMHRLNIRTGWKTYTLTRCGWGCGPTSQPMGGAV